MTELRGLYGSGFYERSLRSGFLRRYGAVSTERFLRSGLYGAVSTERFLRSAVLRSAVLRLRAVSTTERFSTRFYGAVSTERFLRPMRTAAVGFSRFNLRSRAEGSTFRDVMRASDATSQDIPRSHSLPLFLSVPVSLHIPPPPHLARCVAHPSPSLLHHCPFKNVAQSPRLIHNTHPWPRVWHMVPRLPPLPVCAHPSASGSPCPCRGAHPSAAPQALVARRFCAHPSHSCTTCARRVASSSPPHSGPCCAHPSGASLTYPVMPFHPSVPSLSLRVMTIIVHIPSTTPHTHVSRYPHPPLASSLSLGPSVLHIPRLSPFPSLTSARLSCTFLIPSPPHPLRPCHHRLIPSLFALLPFVHIPRLGSVTLYACFVVAHIPRPSHLLPVCAHPSPPHSLFAFGVGIHSPSVSSPPPCPVCAHYLASSPLARLPSLCAHPSALSPPPCPCLDAYILSPFGLPSLPPCPCCAHPSLLTPRRVCTSPSASPHLAPILPFSYSFLSLSPPFPFCRVATILLFLSSLLSSFANVVSPSCLHHSLPQPFPTLPPCPPTSFASSPCPSAPPSLVSPFSSLLLSSVVCAPSLVLSSPCPLCSLALRDPREQCEKAHPLMPLALSKYVSRWDRHDRATTYHFFLLLFIDPRPSSTPSPSLFFHFFFLPFFVLPV
ncbi:hypothetical protein C7M84_025062 [Penaeus vannamei]|uniref:Uncharacterized protein n=1 Tax=Penaeus vannamei TaxID=6689 RepID=A0A3R7MNI5_PENVA|nr:hypothetical protein C7M84_025062 [Penaeus vannamei]